MLKQLRNKTSLASLDLIITELLLKSLPKLAPQKIKFRVFTSLAIILSPNILALTTSKSKENLFLTMLTESGLKKLIFLRYRSEVVKF